MEETFLLFFVERLRIMDCVVLCFDHSGARFPKLRCRTSVVTCLRRTVFTSDCFRQVRVMLLEHSPKSQKCSSDLLPFPEDVAKGINLSVTQVAEFTPAVRKGTLADHQALSRP